MLIGDASADKSMDESCDCDEFPNYPQPANYNRAATVFTVDNGALIVVRSMRAFCEIVGR